MADQPALPAALVREPGTPPIVRFEEVSKWYGNVIGINKLTLHIPAGVTGLLGPNGAGKSTLLQLATGQLRPSQGRVIVLGQTVWGNPGLNHYLGLCPEQDAFWEWMTGRDFVFTCARLTGFSRARGRGPDRAGFGNGPHDRPRRPRLRGYSKGMRQRIKLAQALVHDPEVLFLDEPFTGTDPVARRDLMDIVIRLGKQGKSVVVSSHVLHEVQSLTQNIVLMNRGRLVAEGNIRDIRDLIDKHPHRIVLVSPNYRRLAAELATWEDVEGLKIQGAEAFRHRRDADSGSLLRPVAGTLAAGRDGDRRGLFRGRQPGSGLQVPGETMNTTRSRTDPMAGVSALQPRTSGLEIGPLWTLFTLTLRQFVRGPRLVVLALLTLLPAAIAVIRRMTEDRAFLPPSQTEFLLVFYVIPHALLPLTALLYGTGMILDEQEEQTLTYLLIRPLPKWAIYVTKLAATMCMVAILTFVYVVVTDLATYLGTNEFGQVFPFKVLATFAIMSLATITYAALFGCASLFMQRALIGGIIYIIVIEGILGNVDLALRKLTVVYYFHVMAVNWLDLDPKMSERWNLRVSDSPMPGRVRPSWSSSRRWRR